MKAYRIASGIYQGPCPASPEEARHHGFHVLVFCALEIQPYVPPDQQAGLRFLYVPLDDRLDKPMTDEEWSAALRAGADVARLSAGGSRVLTTCAMGLNRSGIVNAVALHYRFGASGQDAIDRIRLARGSSALHNPSFVRRLQRLGRRAPIS